MFKYTVPAGIIAALIISPAVGRSAQLESMPLLLAQKSSSKPIKENSRNAKLAGAASINEDLIGFALDGKADKVAERVSALRKALPALRPLLNAQTFENVGRQVTDMEQTSAKSDLLGTALASVEAYRAIENAMDAGNRPAPIEVAMLDYSGFKLSILAKAQAADWQTIAATAKESDGSWTALARNVQDVGLRNLVGAIQEGLRDAVGRKDINGVKFAAKMQLEVVDVLEGYFKRTNTPSKKPAR